MKKKIDNFTLIFLLSSIIGFIIGVFYFLFGFIGDSYRKNEYLRANKTYAFERKDPLKTDDSDIILKNVKLKKMKEDKKSTHLKENDINCYSISKITIINDYYVGYIIGENNKKCKGYFYIKKDSYADEHLNLTEKEIEQKFGKNIKYTNPSKFLNKYGKFGNESIDFDNLVLSSILLVLFSSFVTMSIFFLITSIIKKRKFKK
ncbi:hypothetical protein EII29_04560 [Leptotrichia sp. OH3620_COT-345]|uniref:hypothetical protein n=1 Tax=Leptotrichia sp. OH3620_COT-345 TaxID=2491048 RepID=UPI000F64FCBD|nr:hypothetical protein [Leptotrichia sp. OH3620_COT-345]RRD40084.1 hypothetical protein EII29_04560 [Leptotrichia sp. OH3620_COT-345]